MYKASSAADPTLKPRGLLGYQFFHHTSADRCGEWSCSDFSCPATLGDASRLGCRSVLDCEWNSHGFGMFGLL